MRRYNIYLLDNRYIISGYLADTALRVFCCLAARLLLDLFTATSYLPSI
jgi:hypothetical protein